MFAAPPRLKLAPLNVDTSVPDVAGSICNGFRFDVVLTVARPVCKPENAPAVAGTPADEVAPKAGATPLVALAEILADAPAETPTEAPAEAPMEIPAEPPAETPAEMPMFNPALAEVEDAVTNATGGLSVMPALTCIEAPAVKRRLSKPLSVPNCRIALGSPPLVAMERALSLLELGTRLPARSRPGQVGAFVEDIVLARELNAHQRAQRDPIGREKVDGLLERVHDPLELVSSPLEHQNRRSFRRRSPMNCCFRWAGPSWMRAAVALADACMNNATWLVTVRTSAPVVCGVELQVHRQLARELRHILRLLRLAGLRRDRVLHRIHQRRGIEMHGQRRAAG